MTISRRFRPRTLTCDSRYLATSLLGTSAALLMSHNPTANKGVTISNLKRNAAMQTEPTPRLVALTMSRASFLCSDSRLETYRQKRRKMMFQTRRKPANSAKFLTLTRMAKKSAKETVAVWCATSTAASPKERDMTAKSYSLAALTRSRRRRAVIGRNTLNSDLAPRLERTTGKVPYAFSGTGSVESRTWALQTWL